MDTWKDHGKCFVKHSYLNDNDTKEANEYSQYIRISDHLPIITEVIYGIISQHNKDKTYVRLSTVHKAKEILDKHGMVILTGRHGTGKTKMFLDIASLYDQDLQNKINKQKKEQIAKSTQDEKYRFTEQDKKSGGDKLDDQRKEEQKRTSNTVIHAEQSVKDIQIEPDEEDYLPYKIDPKSPIEDLYETTCLFIVDEINQTEHEYLQKLLQCFPDSKSRRVIITCHQMQLGSLKGLLMDNTLLEKDMIVDLDHCLTKGEKEQILNLYMKLHDIVETSTTESNFRDKEILTNKGTKVKLDTDSIKKIITTEPFDGFPLTVAEFCADRQKLHKGETYFTNPSQSLVECMKEIYEIAKTTESMKLKYRYCVLAYITTDTSGHIDMWNIDMNKMYFLQKALFDVNIKMNSDNVSSIIQEAADSLTGTYLSRKGEIYQFIHPYISKAVCLSSDYFIYYLIQKGSLQDIMELIRGFKYEEREGELILKIPTDRNSEMYHILCERLVREAFDCTEMKLTQDIYQYIYDCFIKTRDIVFRQCIYDYMEAIHKNFTRSSTDKSVKKKGLSKLSFRKDKEASVSPTKQSEKSKNGLQYISPMQVITMVECLTSCGKDPWIYFAKKVPNFIIVHGLILGCKIGYTEDLEKKATFEEIVRLFKDNIENKDFLEDLKTPLDEYGNTFYHYLPLYREEEACIVLKQLHTLSKENQNVLYKHNYKEYSPLDIAFYLGKLKLLNTFADKELKNKTLTALAKDGKNNFYEEKKAESEFKLDSNFDIATVNSIVIGKKRML